MTTSPPTNEPPTEETRPKWPGAIALGWGLACAVCAGGMWLFGFLLADYRLPLSDVEASVRRRNPLVIAFAGGFGGLLGALFVALGYAASDPTPREFVRGGVILGVGGGVFALPAAMLCGGLLPPLASSTLFWCLAGFITGLMANRRFAALSHRTRSTTFSWRLPEWLLVRLLPFLAVIALALWAYDVISSTRY